MQNLFMIKERGKKKKHCKLEGREFPQTDKHHLKKNNTLSGKKQICSSDLRTKQEYF